MAESANIREDRVARPVLTDGFADLPIDVSPEAFIAQSDADTKALIDAGTSPESIASAAAAEAAGTAAATSASQLLPTTTTYQLPSALTTNNAFEAFRARFQALGLGSLADSLLELSKSPIAPETDAGWYSALQATEPYKQRFGNTNAARLTNGLMPLTEADMIRTENNIRDTLRTYGLPKGFYDNPSDLADFVSRGFSANEVGDAVGAWQNLAKNQDPQVLQQLSQQYGIGIGEITAHLMDPVAAEPVISSIAQKGTLAAAAAAAGYKDILGAAQMAQQLGAQQLSYQKQAAAFGQAQQFADQAGKLANIYGGTYTTEQGLQEALGGPAGTEAAMARQRLATQETSTFGGSAGAGKGSLMGTEAGQS